MFTFAQARGFNINVTEGAAQLEVMREALGVAQHHDAVSGTEKEFVVTDYKFDLLFSSSFAHRNPAPNWTKEPPQLTP
jgi:hypothetical protein